MMRMRMKTYLSRKLKMILTAFKNVEDITFA